MDQANFIPTAWEESKLNRKKILKAVYSGSFCDKFAIIFCYISLSWHATDKILQTFCKIFSINLTVKRNLSLSTPDYPRCPLSEKDNITPNISLSFYILFNPRASTIGLFVLYLWFASWHCEWKDGISSGGTFTRVREYVIDEASTSAYSC